MKHPFVYMETPNEHEQRMHNIRVKPQLQSVLSTSHKYGTGWISIQNLISEHVIDYSFNTYAKGVLSEEQEQEILNEMLPSIRNAAIEFGWLVPTITSDIDWSMVMRFKKHNSKILLPGVNLVKVTDLGTLAKDTASADLLNVLEV